LGASIENRKTLGRLDALRASAALVRFLSVEPLLEDLGALDLRGIQWVIVGGESGPDFRPMQHEWARAIRDQCVAAGVPFFFKQSAARRTEVGTRLVEADGSRSTWNQYPGERTPPERRNRSVAPRSPSAQAQLPLGVPRKR
jgi:protein gp37